MSKLIKKLLTDKSSRISGRLIKLSLSSSNSFNPWWDETR